MLPLAPPFLRRSSLPLPHIVIVAAERGGGGRSGFGRSSGGAKRGSGGGRGGGRGRGSGGGGGGGGGGGRGRNISSGNSGSRPPAPKKTVSVDADPPEVSNEPSLLSAPIKVTVLERDEAPESAIAPLWDSFCGTSAGGWQGVATAVSPVTGEREAVGLVDEKVVVEVTTKEATSTTTTTTTKDDNDDNNNNETSTKTTTTILKTKIIKKEILALATYTVERRLGGRAGGKGPDRLSRRTVRSPTSAGLAAAAEAAEAAEQLQQDEDPSSSPSSPSFDGVDDALKAKEPGLVIFDGGTCSRGPLNLLGLPPPTVRRRRRRTRNEEEQEEEDEGDDELANVDAEREALERLVALSPASNPAPDFEEEADWSSLEGGGGNDENAAAAAADDDEDEIDVASSPDIGQDPEATVSVIESCLAWGGEQRLRVQLTLSVADDGDELDITPLRILVTREAWQCLPDGDVSACAVGSPEADGREASQSQSQSQSSSSSSSPSSPGSSRENKGAPSSVITSRSTALSTASSLAGTWKVFDVCAHAILESSSSLTKASDDDERNNNNNNSDGDEKSSSTSSTSTTTTSDSSFDLDDPDDTPTAVYSTSRTVQRWELDPTEPPGDGGGAYSLPDARESAADVESRGGNASVSSSSFSSSSSSVSSASNRTGPAPGAALLELVMLDPVSRGADADAIEGMTTTATTVTTPEGSDVVVLSSSSSSSSSSTPLPLPLPLPLRRALLVTCLWSPRDGTVVGLQREYDAAGDLVEVRARTAVRTDVAGGSM